MPPLYCWSEMGGSFAFLPRAKIEEATSVCTGGSNPVAVPEKIFGLTRILDFCDRCHSFGSLYPPPAAVALLPTGLLRFDFRVSYTANKKYDRPQKRSIVFWSEWGDSNSRHPAPKAGALPAALHPAI